MMTRASRMLGNAVSASFRRISTSSTIPPKYPVTAPTMVPAVPPIRMVAAAMTRVVPDPCMTRLKISLPNLSVPNRCAGEGPWSFAELIFVGL